MIVACLAAVHNKSKLHNVIAHPLGFCDFLGLRELCVNGECLA
jgi:hypothetical protein